MSVLSNSSFIGNQAVDGGAIYVFQTGNITIAYCIFLRNYASGNGGALLYYQGLLKIIFFIILFLFRFSKFEI